MASGSLIIETTRIQSGHKLTLETALNEISHDLRCRLDSFPQERRLDIGTGNARRQGAVPLRNGRDISSDIRFPCAC